MPAPFRARDERVRLYLEPVPKNQNGEPGGSPSTLPLVDDSAGHDRGHRRAAKFPAVEGRVARFAGGIRGAKRPRVLGGKQCQVGRLTFRDAPLAAQHAAGPVVNSSTMRIERKLARHAPVRAPAPAPSQIRSRQTARDRIPLPCCAGSCGAWSVAMASTVPSASPSISAARSSREASGGFILKRVSYDHVFIAQREMVRRHFAGDAQAALLGGAHQFERGARRKMRDVQAAPGQFRDLHVARDGDAIRSPRACRAGPAARTACPRASPRRQTAKRPRSDRSPADPARGNSPSPGAAVWPWRWACRRR